MKREVYEAMKARISIIPREEARRIDEEAGVKFDIPEWATIYRFSNDGLNDGIADCDVEFVDPIQHAMKTKNMWNVCQRFYGFIRQWFGESIDDRLLNASK